MANAVVRWSDFRQIESSRRPLAHSAHTVCLWNAITLDATSKWWKASLSCRSPNECYWGKSSLMPSTNTEFLCKKKGQEKGFSSRRRSRWLQHEKTDAAFVTWEPLVTVFPARADLFPSTWSSEVCLCPSRCFLRQHTCLRAQRIRFILRLSCSTSCVTVQEVLVLTH